MGQRTDALAFEIGLANVAELPALQAIEDRAGTLFATHPQTMRLVLSVTPLDRLARAEAARLLWVARVAGVPVGFALVEDFGTSLHLEELDVDPAHGRRGIGRALVRAVRERATGHGQLVTLCTFSEVPWNAPYYERLGFVRLAPEALSPKLRERTEEEARRGLPPGTRVAMQLDTRLR